MTVFPKLAALAVVLQGDHVLLVRRRNPPDAGLWGFPGGHVEPGETARETAARELREETSIIATPRSYLDNIDVIERDSDGQIRFHFLLAAVLCDYVSGTPQAGDDADDAAWVTLAQVNGGDLPLSTGVPELIANARHALPIPNPAKPELAAPTAGARQKPDPQAW